MKKIVSIILSLIIMASTIAAFAYSDVNDESVSSLTNLNVLSGYDDGTFKPDNMLTRAEFSKILSIVNGGPADEDPLAEPTVKKIFTDVTDTHWAYNYILHCEALNLIEGYEDNSFRPNENVTLAEALKICLSSVGYDNMITEQQDEWYKPWWNMAYECGILDNKDGDPSRKITRLEASQMIFKTINLPICVVTGWDFSKTPSIQTKLLDGTDGELETLLIKNFQQ